MPRTHRTCPHRMYVGCMEVGSTWVGGMEGGSMWVGGMEVGSMWVGGMEVGSITLLHLLASDMTRIYETWRTQRGHDSHVWDMTHIYETWLTHMRHDTHTRGGGRKYRNEEEGSRMSLSVPPSLDEPTSTATWAYRSATWAYRSATWAYRSATWAYRSATWAYRSAYQCLLP
jgi:hypothetical protein